jgi:D-alanine-D-alanine ligase
VKKFDQPVLLESLEKGMEFRVSLLGNETVECLPLLQVVRNRRICPARVDEALAERIRECARAAYVAVGCRDYARVDIRLAGGKPQVIGIHSLGIFARLGSFAQSAQEAGYSFGELMQRIVDVAWKRYGFEPAVRVRVRSEVKPALPTTSTA